MCMPFKQYVGGRTKTEAEEHCLVVPGCLWTVSSRRYGELMKCILSSFRNLKSTQMVKGDFTTLKMPVVMRWMDESAKYV